MEEAEDVIPTDILAENILQMAAEMTNVLVDDQELQGMLLKMFIKTVRINWKVNFFSSRFRH